MSSEQKYVICNADEGDPGAFMDRAIIEGDPFCLVEGLGIAAYGIGASKAYVYLRAEYPLAIERLKKAIKQAERLERAAQQLADRRQEPGQLDRFLDERVGRRQRVAESQLLGCIRRTHAAHDHDRNRTQSLQREQASDLPQSHSAT